MINQSRIEVGARVLLYNFTRFLMGETLLVGAFHPKCIVDISDSDNPCRERYQVSLYIIGITAPFPFFMVKQGDILGHRIGIGLQYICAVYRMLLHDRPLPVVERTLFIENIIGNTDFSHIMHCREKRDVFNKFQINFGEGAATHNFFLKGFCSTRSHR